jgi:hypothetical protein
MFWVIAFLVLIGAVRVVAGRRRRAGAASSPPRQVPS